MTDNTINEDMTTLKHISEVLPPIPAPYVKKDRSYGGYKNLKPIQKGEVRNTKGNPRMKEIGMRNAGMHKIKAIYQEEGFSVDQVARRMTHWLNMPFNKAVDKMNDEKTPLFEKLGLSIITKAIETGETAKMNTLLDRIIGPVIQHTTAEVRSLSVTAKADVELLTRIQTDMQHGKLIVNNAEGIVKP